MTLVTLIAGAILVGLGRLEPAWWSGMATAVCLGYQGSTAFEDRGRAQANTVQSEITVSRKGPVSSPPDKPPVSG